MFSCHVPTAHASNAKAKPVDPKAADSTWSMASIAVQKIDDLSTTDGSPLLLLAVLDSSTKTIAATKHHLMTIVYANSLGGMVASYVDMHKDTTGTYVLDSATTLAPPRVTGVVSFAPLLNCSDVTEGPAGARQCADPNDSKLSKDAKKAANFALAGILATGALSVDGNLKLTALTPPYYTFADGDGSISTTTFVARTKAGTTAVLQARVAAEGGSQVLQRWSLMNPGPNDTMSAATPMDPFSCSAGGAIACQDPASVVAQDVAAFALAEFNKLGLPETKDGPWALMRVDVYATQAAGGAGIYHLLQLKLTRLTANLQAGANDDVLTVQLKVLAPPLGGRGLAGFYIGYTVHALDARLACAPAGTAGGIACVPPNSTADAEAFASFALQQFNDLGMYPGGPWSLLQVEQYGVQALPAGATHYMDVKVKGPGADVAQLPTIELVVLAPAAGGARVLTGYFLELPPVSWDSIDCAGSNSTMARSSADANATAAFAVSQLVKYHLVSRDISNFTVVDVEFYGQQPVHSGVMHCVQLLLEGAPDASVWLRAEVYESAPEHGDEKSLLGFEVLSTV